ncbi:MAG TPA: Gfo/Idh/MocA family oxidoreductase [Bryobacteraceae bacterium]|nr:Gfo/Idh/MocA family oxidoreductase [Bryobacteraceae bacterium]
MRIGVIGLGFMGTTHLKGWRKVPDAVLAAVCSDDPVRLTGDLSAVQGNLGDNDNQLFDFSKVATYRQLDELLADPGVEAVDICLPTHLHSEVALKALRRGKHVLVEKPMALDESACSEMLDVAKSSGRLLMVGHVLRFVPAYRAVADRIRSGLAGSVRSVLLRRRCAAPFWSKWLGDPARSGGGVFDLLIHDVDYAISLFGLPEAVAATGHENFDAGIDAITATLLYPDGLGVVITGGWHHRKAYPFSMEFTIVADKGTFEFSSMRGEGVTCYTDGGEAVPLEVPAADAFAEELSYFVDCCRNNQVPKLCPPEESAASVRLARFLLEARRAGGEKLTFSI